MTFFFLVNNLASNRILNRVNCNFWCEKDIYSDRTEVKSTHQFDFYDQWEFKNYAGGFADYNKAQIIG